MPFVGHDSDLSVPAALPGRAVAVPGHAPGDPPPGGASVFERRRAPAGAAWLRIGVEAPTQGPARRLAGLGLGQRPGRRRLATMFLLPLQRRLGTWSASGVGQFAVPTHVQCR